MAQAPFKRGASLFTREELADLDANGQTLRRAAGHIFLVEGEETDFALLIKKGHVKVVVGPQRRIVAIRSAGDIVGEMAAILQQPRTASVIALDDVEVLYLAASAWSSFLDRHPRALRALLFATHEQLELATTKIVESDLAAEQRLALALIELADSGIGTGVDGGVTLRFGQQDLAEFAGISLESIKKIVRAFKEHDIIRTGRQAITIDDLVALKDIANSNRQASR